MQGCGKESFSGPSIDHALVELTRGDVSGWKESITILFEIAWGLFWA